MVSNWFSAISRSRCGNSSVMTPSGFSSRTMPATKSLRSGTCASTLLPMMRSARLPSATSSVGQRLRRRNRPASGMPLSTATLRDVGRRLDAEDGHAERQEVLQQVAVVAGQLDDEAVGPESEPLRDHLAVGLGVRDPGGRVGREIGVLPEDVLRADILLELDQEALAADQHMQREVRLHRVELVAREEALAQRRHAEIDERVLQCRTAKAAFDLALMHQRPSSIDSE